MKLMLVAFSFNKGGAAIAAHKFATMASSFSEVECVSADRTPLSGMDFERPTKVGFYFHFVKRLISYVLASLMRDGLSVKHSLNLFSAKNVISIIQRTGPDIVTNFHWINNDTVSVWRLGALPTKSVITLHDEWLYCGAEHYAEVGVPEAKFTEGYPARDPEVKGINWNRYIWKLKLRQIEARDDFIFTVPSQWMLERARRSKILEKKDVRLLPNPIDTNCFRPINEDDRNSHRAKAGLSDDDIVLAAGAVQGEKNLLKGFGLLWSALAELPDSLDKRTLDRVVLMLFGGNQGSIEFRNGYRVLNYGRVETPKGMQKVYGMADCVIVPSLVESFGQVAAESLACETPVVAFRTSGLTDIVQDEISGYLAQPFEPKSLASCIARMLQLSGTERNRLGRAGRANVEAKFSLPVVSSAYKQILDEVLASKLASSE